MTDIIGMIATLIFGLFAFFVGKQISKKANKQQKPPENKAADVAIGNVQETLKEELDRIRSATTGDSPADDLSDLGNARRR